MKRAISKRLDEWRVRDRRKPLLLQGARQVGKTYSLREFGERRFSRYHHVNFGERGTPVSVFDGDLSPRRLVQDLGLRLGTPIDPNTKTPLIATDKKDEPSAIPLVIERDR